jgi:hypothetical protein
VAVPEGDDVYAYFFDAKQGRWVNWLEGRPSFKIARYAPRLDTTR